MSDLTSLDPQNLATQLAGYDIAAMQTALKKQTSSLTAQKAALTALRTAMSDFRTALTGLNKTDSGMLQNVATTNVEGVATVTAGSKAQKGTYNLFVEQLASAHQIAFNMKDNTELALGNIQDADFASEASSMTRNQMLAQTSMSMLKQSNSMSGMVMSLLG